MSFKIRTFAKWILAGEHTVLRGGTALAFPIQTRFFDLEFVPGHENSYQISLPKTSTVPADVFERTLLRGLEILNQNKDEITGTFFINSNIPLSSGLGGSASICAAVAKLFYRFEWLTSENLFTFCRELENMYHGQSSGLDVATVLAARGISFHKDHGFENIELKWQPNWYLLHSGIHSRTKDDINKVNANRTDETDQQMRKAVDLAKQALSLDEVHGLPKLIEAQKMAADCFRAWNIVPAEMNQMMQELYKAGALAVKPTGSGGGGYILSLWPAGAKPQTSFDLLSVYA
jgi:mevalonate kinase